MIVYMNNPAILRRNKWIDKINPTIYTLSVGSTTKDYKAVLEQYSFLGDKILGFDDRKFVKWICKLPNSSFYAGQLFEPREEYCHLFETGARIMWVPDSLSCWTEPHVFNEDWHIAYKAIVGEKAQIKKEWFDGDPQYLLTLDRVAVDIETTGLNYGLDKIRTIGFAWKEGEVYYQCAWEWDYYDPSFYVDLLRSDVVKVFHNGCFDLTFLCRNLGLHPLDIKNVEDTRLKAYCAYNSARKIDLSLEFLSRGVFGSYKINPLTADFDRLIQYNADDCVATFYLDEITEAVPFYYTLLTQMPKIVGMQLTGWPVDPNTVRATAQQLQSNVAALRLQIEKTVPGLNPDSPKQLQELFFGRWMLDRYGKTKSGQPETGEDALNYFKHQLEGIPEKKAFIDGLIAYKKANKVLTSFIPPMLKAANADGRLRGSYLLGGTKSGRLSSSDPNMQNLPSNSSLAKLIKQCFQPPKGWVIVGADYSALEDRISALTTRDPEKLKVYTDGYDSHCLRAYAYFSKLMPKVKLAEPGTRCFRNGDTVFIEGEESFNGAEEISVEEHNVCRINSVATLYKELRQKSKTASFALTYNGTVITLVKNSGFSYAEAEEIYNSFHRLYKVSDEWIEKQINKGREQGYVTLAYGHRMATPLLKMSVQGKNTPYLALKEFRTAANALGQSYCMITGFTSAAMYREIYERGLCEDILPCGEIHDALYWLVHDNPATIEATRDMLYRHMPNHGQPELNHPTIKLDIDAFIIRKSWAEPEDL